MALEHLPEVLFAQTFVRLGSLGFRHFSLQNPDYFIQFTSLDIASRGQSVMGVRKEYD